MLDAEGTLGVKNVMDQCDANTKRDNCEEDVRAVSLNKRIEL